MVALLQGAKRTLLSRRKAYDSYLRSLPGAVALWPLWETTGTNADDIIGNNDGTYSGVTLVNATHPSGTSVPFFDGINDTLETYSAGLNSVFTPNAFTLSFWFKPDPTLMASTTSFMGAAIGADANNWFRLYKEASSNLLFWAFTAGGTTVNTSNNAGSTNWQMMSITADKTGNKIRFFLDSVQQGSDQVYAGTWAGALHTDYTEFGSLQGALFYKGWAGYLFLANQAYTPAQIADMYNRGLRP